ncbi:MAG: YbaB/EbfC family nucleoid-associated protein [Meiothermus sp.]|uniref:YbaB/EbfC family nucleoid-associated protein n=1 Tax=Meiothermus sp. TaxID=1955249 RepID=UPI0025CD57B8|nr:YbaB/EbfC family nucleoid-associated protein [Meiothermus sp.]MCS7058665.1 YbaB/EbfC family nucleoid-associated protein [Meiothermus sp.]MCS7195257.1 YbaB/EbfC family nucleoid-associated protein [Meiothermus sp.]MDW8090008.1 YbaB/EbfC family nucleoid-associated protein [Meiothermus sp.]MDW8480659.1 YbaB/EbfC family nucleoid-associated protein [Meiothermus sp.]
MNLQKIMKEAQRAQRKAAEVQERLAQMSVVGSAGGGLVEITANGHGQIQGVRLKPEALDKSDLEALEDLILVAIQDAQKKAHDLSEREMSRELGGIGSLLGKMF